MTFEKRLQMLQMQFFQQAIIIWSYKMCTHNKLDIVSHSKTITYPSIVCQLLLKRIQDLLTAFNYDNQDLGSIRKKQLFAHHQIVHTHQHKFCNKVDVELCVWCCYWHSFSILNYSPLTSCIKSQLKNIKFRA